MEQTARRTPEVPIKELFLRASEEIPGDARRSGVVAESLGYLQKGFDSHYDTGWPEDMDILVGDRSYAWAIETIARLDEPAFVAVASRLIRDGAGRISAEGDVDLEVWIPHLAGLLSIISGEEAGKSAVRIRAATGDLESPRS
ncbi:MAG: hypothetical protein H0V53_01115 [Rubrobacter sp.]|nr:hypothetical protein [Rubrobacter sp.]